MRPDKLQRGQEYNKTNGKTVTIQALTSTLHHSLKRVGSTFAIDSTAGWYYGDGPMIGKWVLDQRFIGDDADPNDLVLEAEIEPQQQLSLFD